MRHEVVHNKYVVDGLRAEGVVFVDELDEVPDSARSFSAPTACPRRCAKKPSQRGLKVFDATCPLVTKVHMEVERHRRAGQACMLIGHAGHPEVEGTMGQWQPAAAARSSWCRIVESVQGLTVATPIILPCHPDHAVGGRYRRDHRCLAAALSQDQGPRKDDICYATQNRQDAVKMLAQECDVVLVMGSPTSSNSNRLRELVAKNGKPAYLIDGAEEIQREWLADGKRVGITAGASAPEVLVQEVIAKLQGWGAAPAREMVGRPENIVFSLPKELNV